LVLVISLSLVLKYNFTLQCLDTPGDWFRREIIDDLEERLDGKLFSLRRLILSVCKVDNGEKVLPRKTSMNNG
jgi:hypothetical protein